MILYIHGFGSTGVSFKSELLKKHFPNETILSPNLRHEPLIDLFNLYELVGKYKGKENVLIVGTSLGGYYAYHLSRMLKVPCCLVNPSMKPYETLRKSVGTCENYNTGESFEWTEEHCNELSDMVPLSGIHGLNMYFPELVNVFVGEKDETLNHSNVEKIFPEVEIKRYPNENHRFRNFGLLMEEFELVLNK